MLFTTVLRAFLAGTALASASDIVARQSSGSTCRSQTFKLTLDGGPSWAGGLYAQTIGSVLYFSTNDTSAAALFTLDVASGQLQRILYGTRFAYFEGGSSAANATLNIRFGNPPNIKAQGVPTTNVTCQQAVAKQPLQCYGGPSGSAAAAYGAWQMCYNNEYPVSLVKGTAAGPYDIGHPNADGTTFCGKAKVVPTEITCTN